jgi:hypothetical protein
LLTPVILATWEAEIGKIMVPGWPQTKKWQGLISTNMLVVVVVIFNLNYLGGKHWMQLQAKIKTLSEK